MQLEKKWYNIISFVIMVVFAISVYRIMSIVVQVELGHAPMNTAMREEIYSNIGFLFVVVITLFIQKKDENRMPLKSEA